MPGSILERSLKMVAGRLYKLRVLRRQAMCWLLLLVPAIALAIALPTGSGVISAELLVLLAITIAGLGLARFRVAAPTALETARLVEKCRPELNDAILTAVQSASAIRGKGNPSVLNQWVLEEADRLAGGTDWRSVVPTSQIFRWSALSFLAFSFMISGVLAAGRWGREPVNTVLTATNGDDSNSINNDAETEVIVEPGDVEIERGSALTVVARFGRNVPAAVLLRLQTEEGAIDYSMEPTVDGGVFATRINAIEGDCTYRVVFADSVAELAAIDGRDPSGKSETFRITTYVRPRLNQTDAKITPPAYTGKPSQLIEDTLRVTAVEGSQIELILHLNKPVAIAELRGKESTLQKHTEDPNAGTVTFRLEAIEDQKFQVFLQDAEGRTAAEEEQITVRVTRNKRPKLKVTFPGRDTNVSPLQEFQIAAEATDDFGFADYGVKFSLSGKDSGEISLAAVTSPDPTGGKREIIVTADGKTHRGTVTDESSESLTLTDADGTTHIIEKSSIDTRKSKAAPQKSDTRKISIEHTIDMEALQASPDDLLTYYFYVEDAAADGSLRRTYSDMMFAEVRRFEEIFRESQQQNQQQQQQQQNQQQQQQQGSQTEQLMELQRQIIIATWNIQRTLDESRSRAAATARAAEDAAVVEQSQLAAIEQLQAVKEEAADDPDTLKLVNIVDEEMNRVIEKISTFRQSPEDSLLSEAILAEQSAFAGLMRMRAREHEVQQSQQSQSQSQSQSRQNSASQQQLRQLELDNERNRYESERQAQEQQEQTAAQREQLQILNRLKELARRQQMLNERLKQLESELRAAETEEEKAEIERELKRLRDEQREMLRDVDELRETMDQQSTEQQQQNQQTRDQVEQARERVQQASQAMDEGRLSEAISEGTRAERQFDNLQEQFRQQTSNQFSEAMRDLRQQAREMTERQKEISKELTGESGNNQDTERRSPSLRSDRDRDSIEQQVAEQRDSLERVLEQARQIVEEAEESEPLLSRRLYDTIRDTREKKPEEALQATEILVNRGLWDQSQQAEQIARKGIENLTKGIENAADAVLGSEAESLRRAASEIEDLTNQLSDELADATEQTAGEAAAENSTRAPAEQSGDPQSNREADNAGQSASQQRSNQRQGTQRVASPLRTPAEEESTNREGSSPGSQPGGEPRETSTQPSDSAEPTTERQNNAERRQPGQGQSQQETEGDANQSQQDAQQNGGGGQQPDNNQSGEQPDGPQQEGGRPGQNRQQQQGTTPSQNGDAETPSGQNSSPQAQQPGQNGATDQTQTNRPGQQQQPGGQNQSGQAQQQGNGQRQNPLLMNGGRQQSTGGGGGRSQSRPLTGDEYSEWSNRMREVEEILDDQELRNRVAQVRDRARSIRAEFRRHGTEPKWDLVRSQLLDELIDLQSRLNQELSKLESDRSMVPIDRDPVPEEFDELVRRYYELLGQSRQKDNP